jgi:hypothetical protein
MTSKESNFGQWYLRCVYTIGITVGSLVFAFGLSATLTQKTLELLFPPPPHHSLVNFISKRLTMIQIMTNYTWIYKM